MNNNYSDMKIAVEEVTLFKTVVEEQEDQGNRND